MKSRVALFLLFAMLSFCGFAYSGTAEDIPNNPRNSSLMAWSCDMKALPSGSSIRNDTATGTIDSSAGLLKIEGLNPKYTENNVTKNAYVTFFFGQTINSATYPYLRMKIRVTKGMLYYLRPIASDGKLAYPDNWETTFIAPAMEKRVGTWDETGDPNGGWEDLTFNIDSYTTLHKTQTKSYNQLSLVILPTSDTSVVPTQPKYLRMQIASMTVHKGILSETVLSEESVFHDGLDNDGDGKVDRDDSDFDKYRMKKVMPVYQTHIAPKVWYDSSNNVLYSGKWAGYRRPKNHVQNATICGRGLCPKCYFINPGKSLGKSLGKRAIMSTRYPLNYLRFPKHDYDVKNFAGRAFNEFADQNEKGIWVNGGKGAQSPAPSDQFSDTPLNYESVGAFEEYDLSEPSWINGSVNLARDFGADGFVFNDQANYEGYEPYVKSLYEVVKTLNTDRWSNNPFLLAPFYTPTNFAKTVEAAAADLSYIAELRVPKIGLSNLLQYNGRPVVFVTPTQWYKNDNCVLDTVEKWDQMCGLMRESSEDYDGLFAMPQPQPDVKNFLRFRFDDKKVDSVGALTANIDYVEFLDKEMNRVEYVDLGTQQARDENLTTPVGDPKANGWAHDVTTEPSYTFARDNDYSIHSKPRSLMQLTIPKNVKYMRIRILAATGLPDSTQWVEMSVMPMSTPVNTLNNATDCGIRFSVTSNDWAIKTFRLTDLPDGFDFHNYTPQPKSELPVSLWGDVIPFINRYDHSGNYTTGFEGIANYVSGDSQTMRDVRSCVNYPYLQVATVRPRFDDSGLLYYEPTDSKRDYFTASNYGARMRLEFESVIKYGADSILITSWNEWGEGTAIEPTIEEGFLFVRLMLTYSLMYHDQMSTAKWPSETNLTIHRYDREGTTRRIKFVIGGSDTITFKDLPLKDSANIVLKRNNTVVSESASGNNWFRSGNNIIVNETNASGATWEISYESKLTYSLNSSLSTLPETGGRYSVNLVSEDPNWSWTASSDASWLNLENTSGTGSASIYFSVDANRTSADRVATITVGEASVSITQEKHMAEIQFSVSRLDMKVVTGKTASQDVVATQKTYATHLTGYTVSCDDNWLSVTPTYGENVGSAGLTHTVTVDSAGFSVGQHLESVVRFSPYPSSEQVTLPVSVDVISPVTNNLILSDADFSPDSSVAKSPGDAITASWSVSGTAESGMPYWLEMMPSKSGGFELLRSGQTICDSSKPSSYENPFTLTNSKAKVKWLPDGVYTLCPIVNRPGTSELGEVNYIDNWFPIPRKRLYVRNTIEPSCDLVIASHEINRNGLNVTIRATVKNNGPSAIPSSGCWAEIMRGTRDKEGKFTVSNYLGAGAMLKSLAAGAQATIERSGKFPEDTVFAIMIDSTDLVPETDERNNFSLIDPNDPQFTGTVDIEMLDAVLDSSQAAPVSLDPSAGTSLKWSVTMRNNSSVAANDFYVELFPSQTGGLDQVRTGKTICWSAKASLAAYETKTITFTKPLNLISDGIYSLVAVANRSGVSGNIADSNPRNNSKTMKSRAVLHNATPAESDLELVEGGLTIARTGNNVQITGTVANAGTGASSQSWVEAWYGTMNAAGVFSRVNIIGRGVLVDTLQPGATQTFSISGTVPDGNWVIGVMTDITDIVPELDETNNYQFR
ncbi:MAG: CARDB domain-containing protein [Candidatus Sumerlaeales bacterium]|nr:CARDB domain-containing protein [Candidatus Sumerlaeales bacterium]